MHHRRITLRPHKVAVIAELSIEAAAAETVKNKAAEMEANRHEERRRERISTQE